ncbi:MAG: hypothetical protein JW982_09240 [Spirochaetes bacterium]|nr:hypothetical protein [Spirochaetota bacterium]
MKIIVVAAFKQEAQYFLNKDKPEKTLSFPFPVYDAGRYSIVISGPGKTNAASAVTCMLAGAGQCHVINAGSAGALKADIREGSTFAVNKIFEADRHLLSGEKRFLFTENITSLPSAVCLCRDIPVITAAERDFFSSDADIADMESAAVFQICRLFKAGCSIIKTVSDSSSCSDKSEIINKISAVSVKLYETVSGLMERIEN